MRTFMLCLYIWNSYCQYIGMCYPKKNLLTEWHTVKLWYEIQYVSRYIYFEYSLWNNLHANLYS